MKKLFLTFILTSAMTLLITGLVYSESLDEMKARLRREVRSEMGVDSTPKRVDSTQRTVVRPKSTKKAEPSKTVSEKLREITILEDVDYDTACKAFLAMMLIALIPAIIAKIKGRSFIAWWVLALLFFIVVFPASVFMKKI